MKKHLFWVATLAMGLYACSDNSLTPDGDVVENDPAGSTDAPAVYHAELASVASSQSRVSVAPQSRASESQLTLIAEIDNLSKEEGRISGFTSEDRYLSATCVYYDQNTGKYYVTYHMQGNNYNTDQTVETTGFIETFSLAENQGDGLKYVPVLDKIYSAKNPAVLDFDFNHLYFDNLSDFNYNQRNLFPAESGVRIIAGGHSSKPTVGGKYDTKAIIAQLNLQDETIDYTPVLTGNKILDANGKSLGDEDARDVNSIIRKWDYYYLATRKGLAVLYAGGDKKFQPITDADDKPYFIYTPGSAKHVVHQHVPGNRNSYFGLLYLNNPTPEGGLTASSHSPATLAKFGIVDVTGRLCRIEAGNPTINNITGYNIDEWVDLQPINGEITPMDGKNVIYWGEDDNRYVALGKGGLYAYHRDYYNDGKVLTFTDAKEGGSRPVNGLFVERLNPNPETGAREGFIYVANGACLTILDERNLDKVAEFSAFKEGDASANYVHVVSTEEKTNGQTPDRIITVAYGQAGVKVFKFVPPTY